MSGEQWWIWQAHCDTCKKAVPTSKCRELMVNGKHQVICDTCIAAGAWSKPPAARVPSK